MNLSSRRPSGNGRHSAASGELDVALLTLDFPPSVGGVQQYLYEVSRRIAMHTRLTVVCPGIDRLRAETEPFQVAPISAGTAGRFWRALAELRPHLIIVGHANLRLLVPPVRSRRRFVAIAHGNDFESAQRRWHVAFFNHLLSRARPLITNSQANAHRLRALNLPAPVVIPPGTDPARFVPPRTPRSMPPVLLTVGRLVPRKGIDTVLRALPRLLDHTPQLEYWIAGDGPQRPALEELARNLGVTGAVKFLGFVADDELPQIYQRATIFVMPTRADYEKGDVEGFGIVYLEASASGLPVVAARSGGAAEAVRDGETGVLVPPDDPHTLAESLTHLIDDPVLCRRLGRGGRLWVENEMNWDRAARQLLDVLEAWP